MKFLCSQIMSYLCQKCKTWGHRLRFKDKRVEKYPDFETFAGVIQHGLQRFIIKNADSESTVANGEFSENINFVRSIFGCVRVVYP